LKEGVINLDVYLIFLGDLNGWIACTVMQNNGCPHAILLG
jgi:uncharacterized membrane protein YeaQ/YmgE (transglycosylase-associated protein family)